MWCPVSVSSRFTEPWNRRPALSRVSHTTSKGNFFEAGIVMCIYYVHAIEVIHRSENVTSQTGNAPSCRATATEKCTKTIGRINLELIVGVSTLAL